jgi:Flp pilus assembly protein TadG
VDLRTLLRRARRDASGAAMVEFALVLPLLLTLILGIVEFGRLWNVRQVMTDATREGTRVAVVNNRLMPAGMLQDSVRRTIQRRMRTAALDTTRLSISWTNVGADPATPATVIVQYQYELLFGGFVLGRDALPLQSTFVMRNE